LNLARWADILLVAPATANCLAKFSYGLADDLLSTLYLAVECPIFMAPAMNQAMWHKPATQEHGIFLTCIQQLSVYWVSR
jgi:phosphopantothenoylcysteine decarboxylase/phosphopantothenate--cysteine ligase